MASELVGMFVINERDITVGASRSPSAIAAYNERCETASVLEHQSLLAVLQSLLGGQTQRLRQNPIGELAFALFFHVDDFNSKGELHPRIARKE